MSYALAAYALVLGGLVGYTSWLVRSARRLEREVRARAGTNRG